MAEVMNNQNNRIQMAMDMAKHYHAGQTRRGGSGYVPYYDEHILGVYNILREECSVFDEDVLVIALLHDTVEDTDCSLEEIQDKFGYDIKEQVRLLTRRNGEPFSEYSERLFREGSWRAILVKLADRLNNLRTIVYMPDVRWINKKLNQSRTDILQPLEKCIDKLDSPYEKEMGYLAEEIEKQIEVVRKFLAKADRQV
jgi:(p)ppGpp synthase/HD superfamily hydrolase